MSVAMDSQPGRPRAKSGAFSFRSQGSEDNNNPASKSPKSKHSRKESDSERRKTHYDPSTKANPNAAMNEAQPSTCQQDADEHHASWTDVNCLQSPPLSRSPRCSPSARSSTAMPMAT
jgi:hypothetical protein